MEDAKYPLWRSLTPPLVALLEMVFHLWKSMFEQCHFELSYKMFRTPCKNCENHKTFLLKTFMVYGNILVIYGRDTQDGYTT